MSERSPDFMVYNVTNNTFIIMDFYLDYILDLPGVKVESCTQIDGKILLGLRIVGEGMVCHHCQNYTEQLHQNRPILVRDLPVFGRPVYLQPIDIKCTTNMLKERGQKR